MMTETTKIPKSQFKSVRFPLLYDNPNFLGTGNIS